MKRKCRKGEKVMKKSKYKVAKYMRLSRDDGDDRESESIENQIELCKNQLINKYNINTVTIATKPSIIIDFTDIVFSLFCF